MAKRPNIDVRTLREAKALSQDMLATMAGVSVRSIRRMEAGERVSAETIRCVAAALDVTPVEAPPLDIPDGSTLAMSVQPSLPTFEIASPNEFWGPVALQGMAATMLVLVFMLGETAGLGIVMLTATAFFAVAATVAANASPLGPRLYVLAFASLVVVAIEILALTNTHLLVARMYHACAIAIGAGALSGIVFRMVRERRSGFWTLPCILLSGALAGVALAPLGNLVLDIVEAKVRMESNKAEYLQLSEKTNAKANRTLHDEWIVYRFIYAGLYDTPLGPPTGIPDDFHDFDLFKKRKEFESLCPRPMGPERSSCLRSVYQKIPMTLHPVPFTAVDMLKSLFAVGDRSWKAVRP